MLTSVKLILYSLIAPFCSGTGGGAQVVFIEVELTEARRMLRGELEGATKKKKRLNCTFTL